MPVNRRSREPLYRRAGGTYWLGSRQTLEPEHPILTENDFAIETENGVVLLTET